MTTREILIAARERIAAGWSQNAGRRAKDGTPYPPMAETAAYCPTAALHGPGGRVSLRAIDAALEALLAALISDERQRAAAIQEQGRACFVIQRWNDMPGRTQDEVLWLYDRAIAAA